MRRIVTVFFALFLAAPSWSQNVLVLQSDFGTKDGAVALSPNLAFSPAQLGLLKSVSNLE